MADQTIKPLTATEESLADDSDGTALRALVAELEATEADLKKLADSGLPPDEFRKAEAVGQALGVAKVVAGKTWAQVNKGD